MKKTFKFNNFTLTTDQEVNIHITDYGDVEVSQNSLIKNGNVVWPTPVEFKDLGDAIGGLAHGDVSKAVTKANFNKGQTRLVLANSETAIRSAGYRFNFKLKVSDIGGNRYSVTRVK